MAGFLFWYAVIFTWVVLATDYSTYRRDKKYMLISFVISVVSAAVFAAATEDLTLSITWGQ